MQREIDKLAGAACPDSRMRPDLENAGASLTSK